MAQNPPVRFMEYPHLWDETGELYTWNYYPGAEAPRDLQRCGTVAQRIRILRTGSLGEKTCRKHTFSAALDGHGQQMSGL